MKGSANLQISTHPPEPEKQAAFDLWTGPSSPPFRHPQHPTLRANFNGASSLASSPSTPSDSEFEFGSIASFEIRDEAPISPKLIAADFWTSAAAAGSPSASKHTIAPLSHPPTSTSEQPRPSHSVRQLLEEEMHSTITEEEEEDDDDLPLGFYSAPQTPMRTPRGDGYADSKQRPPLSLDEHSVTSTVSHDEKRGAGKSKSSLLGLLDEDQRLQSCKSEPDSQLALWAASSAAAWDHDQKGEEQKGGLKKQGSSRSGVRWAFRDLLRRTVPSSKAEASYITKAMGSGPSKHGNLSLISPSASPAHASASASAGHTAAARRPPPSPTPISGGRHLITRGSGDRPSTTPPSPQRRPPSTPGRRAPTNHHPIPSPPQSPLSHYQQNRAQSLELTRKTFLPYKQSLLGCLGGSAAFSSEQQVW